MNCTKPSGNHNLDVMHLGCCTTCGGTNIIPTIAEPLPVSPSKPTSEYIEGLLRKQIDACSVIPQLLKSQGHQNHKEINYHLDKATEAIKGLPTVSFTQPQLREGEVEDGWVKEKPIIEGMYLMSNPVVQKDIRKQEVFNVDGVLKTVHPHNEGAKLIPVSDIPNTFLWLKIPYPNHLLHNPPKQ